MGSSPELFRFMMPKAARKPVDALDSSETLAMFLNRPATSIPLALLLTGFSLGFMAKSASAETDPKAKSLLEAVIKAHQDLPSYADHGEFVLAMNVRGKATRESIPISITFARPDKIRIETPLSTLVSDGKILTSSLKPLKKYTVAPAPKPLNFATLFTEGPVGSAIFGGPGGPPLQIPLNLLIATDPWKAIRDLGQDLKLAPDGLIDGKTVNIIRIETGKEPAYQIAVDPDTKWLRGVDIVCEAWNPKDSIPGADGVKIETFRWTPGVVETKPAADSAFVYTPPDDFKKVDELTDEKPKEAPAGKVGAATKPAKTEDFIDKPAPDFRLTLLEANGSTKTISKADLAGKVVVINFWATWCVPCLNELPEIQTLTEKCAAGKQDALIISLSQDDSVEDPAALRKLVESTLADRTINLTKTASGKVGVDPSGAVASSFLITGLPSAVVLDAEGVVRSVHVDPEPRIGEVLLKEIDRLLATKSH